MIEHCISALNKERKEEAFKIYVTDALKAAYGLNMRWIDIFKPEEKRTAEEITESLSEKLRKIGGE